MTRHKTSYLAWSGRSLTWLMAGAMILVTAQTASVGAKVLKAPGSRVAMDLPLSYEVSKLYNGFIMPQSRISIIVFEFPASSLDAMRVRLTPEALLAKGLTNVVEGKLKRAGEHLYVTAQQAAAKSSPSKLVEPLGRIKKHFLLFRNGDNAALLTANVPETMVEQGLVSPTHIATVFSAARIEAEAAPGNDPFTLGYLGRFKEAGKLQAAAKLYTEDGRLIPAQRGVLRNAVLVAPSINRLPVSDVAAFAKRAWGGFRGYDGLKIVEEAKTTSGGLEGYWIKGTGTRKTAAGAVPVYLSQVFLKRSGGGYFRIILVAKDAERAELEPEFAKIVAGFKPRS